MIDDAVARSPTRATALDSLAGLVDVLGHGLLRVAAAPRGLDASVGEPVVYDARHAWQVQDGDILLAVGVDPASTGARDLVRACGAAGAAAVVVTADADVPQGLLDTALEAQIALLTVPNPMSWGQLFSLIRTARSAAMQRAAADESAGAGDLFTLADAIAGACGGAVTIEDTRSVVLAYSSTGYPMDGPRRDTILGRRVPDEWMLRLHEAGVFKRLWTGTGVVSVTRAEFPDASDRLAVAVRAGGEVLGSIWVQAPDEGLSPRAPDALAQAASMAALHLLEQRSAQHVERRRSADRLRAVLAGALPPSVLYSDLALGARECVVLLAISSTRSGPAGTAQRAADLLALTCDAFRLAAVTAADGDVTYAAVGAAADLTVAGARQLASDLAARVSTGLRAELHCTTTHQAISAADLVAAKRDIDLALDALIERGDIRTAHIADVRPGIVLRRLRILAGENPDLSAGVVRELSLSPGNKDAYHVQTLRAFLDAFGDMKTAAASLSVHPNTFRYRLRRALTTTGLNLDDPVERLIVHLQLYLLPATTARAAIGGPDAETDSPS